MNMQLETKFLGVVRKLLSNAMYRFKCRLHDCVRTPVSSDARCDFVRFMGRSRGNMSISSRYQIRACTVDCL